MATPVTSAGRPLTAPRGVFASPPLAPTPDAMSVLMRQEPPDRDLVDLAARMGRTAGPAPTGLAAPRPAPAIGDKERFWVHDIVAEQYFQITATLQAATDVAYFWVQDGYDFDPARLQAGAEEFTTNVYPAVRATFGEEWSPGVDQDPHLHVLHHQPIRGVAGYYSSADEFTTAVDPHSNEREMFYINTKVYDPGSFDWLSLLAHEFQHMVHWHMDQNESVWANEGLSELATIVAGYQTSNATVFFDDPDVALLEWNEDPSKNAPDYAASFAFFTYLYSRDGADGIRDIVAAPQNGANGVEAGLAGIEPGITFDDLFLDWAVANVVDDPGVADGRFSYRDHPMGAVVPRHLDMAKGASLSPYASAYYDASDQAAGGELTLTFAGDTSAALLEPGATDQGTVWWSNRGDGIDSRLTRAFDLTGVSSAALDLKAWYSLEQNWDFAYVLVSTNNGATWQRIPTDRTTDADPNGNNYGQGLTGRTDGWVDQHVDLSPFAGQPILVRFEVITDDAVNLQGMGLDDVRLDAVGFSDDASTDAGWTSDGWLRLNPWVPARWEMQAAVIDAGGHLLDLERAAVAPDGTGALTVRDIPAGAQVVALVSNLTRGSRYPGHYTLTAAGGDGG